MIIGTSFFVSGTKEQLAKPMLYTSVEGQVEKAPVASTSPEVSRRPGNQLKGV